MSDVLVDAGYSPNDKIKHIHFNGLDGYGASVPIEKVLNSQGDVILATKMNGESIPVDHGYPLRVLIPGHVAARSVKWIDRILLSDDESPSHWQQKDYKGFSPSASLETSDYSKAESIQEMPVQSAITYPRPGQTPAIVTSAQNKREILVKGYAWSGGGKGINRVDVSADGGETWVDAKLKQSAQPWGQQWAWTKWEASVAVPDGAKEAELVCKAVDSAYQVQPEGMKGIYNVRGVLVNAWHRFKVSLEKK